MKMSRLRITLLAVLAVVASACAEREHASAVGNDVVMESPAGNAGAVDSATTAAADLAAASEADIAPLVNAALARTEAGESMYDLETRRNQPPEDADLQP